MVFDFSNKVKLMVDMSCYIEGMIEEFPIKLKEIDTVSTPAADDLFSVYYGEKLKETEAEQLLLKVCVHVKEPDQIYT
jgi:hypothetical protein